MSLELIECNQPIVNYCTSSPALQTPQFLHKCILREQVFSRTENIKFESSALSR